MLASLRARPDEAAPLDELHRQFHKLAGAGGTFGLSDLSSRVRALEQATGARLAGPQTVLDSSFLEFLAKGLLGLARVDAVLTKSAADWETLCRQIASVLKAGAPAWRSGGSPH